MSGSPSTLSGDLITADPATDASTYRDAMSRLASGVAVITSSDTTGRPHGLTVSSLASHSIAPPTLLASIHLDSRTFAALATTGAFVAHLLAADQREVAEIFATPGSQRRFDAVGWRREAGLPLLDGTIATMRCELAACYPHGDHGIVLGTVHEVTVADGAPLVYVDRHYVAEGG